MEKLNMVILGIASIKTTCLLCKRRGLVNIRQIFLSVLLILLSHSQCSVATQENDVQSRLLKERQRLAKEWAPLVWLHSKEIFFPSHVEYFLSNTIPSSYLDDYYNDYHTLNISNDKLMIPVEEDSMDSYLIAPLDIECSNCPMPKFLFGLKPTSQYTPPVYATIHSCTESDESITQNYSSTLFTEEYDTDPRTNNISSNISFKSSTNKEDFTETTKQSNVLKNLYNTLHDRTTNTILFPSTNSITEDTTETINTSKSTTNSSQSVTESLNTTNSILDLLISEKNYTNVENLINEESILTTKTFSNNFIEQNFTVTYWMFYPYNNGKIICSTKFWGLGRIPKLLENGSCKWDEITIGNHVGDWEHVSIFFKGSKPEKMYVSTHYFGAFYKYNESEHKFIYYGQDARVGPLLNVDYPKEVLMNGMQPVLYSALGSHGLWTTAGHHMYNSNIVPLHDDTDEGVLWNTSKNIQILDRKDMVQMYRHDRQWLRYKGHWGNPSYNCHIGLLGFCELTSGPRGIPMKRVNFPCHDPQDSTFYPSP